MASLRARHSRNCGYGTTKFADWPLADCACTPGPSYFIDYGIDTDTGKHRVESAGRNRKEAERSLRKRQTEQDEGSFRFRENVKFSAWADEWLASFKGKESTRRVYGTTLEYAKRTFGTKSVRELSTADARRFLDLIERETSARSKPKPGETPKAATPGTLAKHLRQLGACLSAAVAEGYAAENVVRRLRKSQRPKVQKSRPTYFLTEELARLWTAGELVERPVYLALCKFALATGLRSGELLALRWSDVHLLRNEVEIQRTLTPDGETAPKSGEARTIDLTPGAAAVLADWFKESDAGERPNGLVFERETGGHIDASYLTKGVLYKAMKRAGIPREGERGRARTFHSLRHTFARLALENGAEITWVQRQLGHSTIVLTVNVYGSWARTAEKAQAARLEGAFPI